MRSPIPQALAARTAFAVGAALALWASHAAALDDPPPTPAPQAPEPTLQEEEREAVVTLRSGQRIQGILVKADGQHVVIRVAGIEAPFAAADVERYELLPPLMERYRDLRKAVGDDPDQILALAQWLREREKFELALAEVDRALSHNPEHGPCRRLKHELEQQILLKMRAIRPTTPKPEPESDVPGGAEAGPRRPRATDVPLLNAAQVALLKVYEVDLAERPRLVVPRETIDRMLEKHAGHPLLPTTKEGRDALYRKDPAHLLDLIFRLQARDLYPQVQVLDMPGSVRKFRDGVQATWLLNSCATITCHGGTDAGRLVLATRRPNAEPTVYTNLLILQRFRTADGKSLIDWEHPERSPLLQLGLPRKDSLFPHPPAPMGVSGREGWKPFFRSTDDRTFERSVEWIRSMYRPRPEYPIEYEPIKPFVAPPPPAPPAPPVPTAPTSPPPQPTPESNPPESAPGPLQPQPPHSTPPAEPPPR
ncbi:MAG: hypothetical protein KF869_00315 [Phycisphaeraceae bacterium]|nr:hypothetical protein [Phycisphaeraceae bacterium]